VSDVARFVFAGIALSLIAGSAVNAAFLSVLKSHTRTVVHQMEWEPGGTPDYPGGETKIVLSHDDCGALNQMIASDAVARYLESSGTNKVTVTYEIVEDFGRIWSYTILSVGPVQVRIGSGESIRKEKDTACIFQPDP
jgi:hypothetical protein